MAPASLAMAHFLTIAYRVLHHITCWTLLQLQPHASRIEEFSFSETMPQGNAGHATIPAILESMIQQAPALAAP